MDNRQIVDERMASYNLLPGPRVGDWVELDDGKFTRLTHDWGDTIQDGGEGGSFYLDGYISYSGSLDPGISRSRLSDTGKTKLGTVWIFRDDHHVGHNGIDFRIPFRVFTKRN